MHSFRELLTATTKIFKRKYFRIPSHYKWGFMPVYHFNDNFKRRQNLTTCIMTEKSELQSREQFQARSSGRVSQFLSDKKCKQHTDVENKLKCTIRTSHLSKVMKKILLKMYPKLPVDVCFPTVITAASCEYDNTNQNQTLLMI